jgi:hypothetical protein
LLSWSNAAQAQLAGGSLRPAAFLRVATSPTPVRMWAGIGDFPYGPDLVEPDADATYFGFGTLDGWPAMQSLINGEAERCEFKMSGSWVTPEILSLASYNADAIRSVVVNMGLLVLDGDLQPLSPMAWLWDGTADSLTVDRSDDKGGSPIRTLTLSVGSAMTGRRRPTPEYWTDLAQEAQFPGDLFCSYVNGYSAGTTRVWPP